VAWWILFIVCISISVLAFVSATWCVKFSGSEQDEFISDSSELSSDDSEVRQSPERAAAEPAPEQKADGLADLPFVRELEFVQCLANPRSLNYPVQRNFFGDPAFLNYVYWTRTDSVKFLRFPQGIHFLRLLEDPDFRRELTHESCMPEIEGQELRHFDLYRRNWLDLSPLDVEV
jgi:mediator of RNA polymerase II transcription subunit 31